MTTLSDRLDADTAARLAALAEHPKPTMREQLVAAAADNRCRLCLEGLDEPAPGCAGPHVGPARRRRPAQGAHARRRS